MSKYRIHKITEKEINRTGLSKVKIIDNNDFSYFCAVDKEGNPIKLGDSVLLYEIRKESNEKELIQANLMAYFFFEGYTKERGGEFKYENPFALLSGFQKTSFSFPRNVDILIMETGENETSSKIEKLAELLLPIKESNLLEEIDDYAFFEQAASVFYPMEREKEKGKEVKRNYIIEPNSISVQDEINNMEMDER